MPALKLFRPNSNSDYIIAYNPFLLLYMRSLELFAGSMKNSLIIQAMEIFPITVESSYRKIPPKDFRRGCSCR